MAEEGTRGKTTFEDLVLMLFALLILGQIFQHVGNFFNENFGGALGGSHVLMPSAALSADTELGTKVNAPDGTAFYARSGGDDADKLGSFGPGTTLVLRDGPEVDDAGQRWWYVEDPETGEKGWVPESALVLDGAGGLSPLTDLGTRVRALTDASVWDSPGGLGLAVARMKMGEWGSLADGPETRNGSRWWFFDRDGTDDDGWVPESALTLYSDTGWKAGSPVVGTRVSDLYERAGGGGVVGILKEGQKATVVGGPVLVGGAYWWLVELEDGTRGWVPESALESGGLKGMLRSVVTVLVIVGTIITIILVGGIVYVSVRTGQIRAREARRIREAVPKAMEPKRNERWDKVLEHTASDNPNDWRLAIIEADIMLDEVVMRMGYQGGTLGDKLKQIARGDLQSLDAAWEAHKVRNQIAHEGSDYILTQREAKRVIDLYGAVFEEVKFI